METTTPSLDTWTSFFILAAAQGYFLAAILFFNKQGTPRANRLLGLFLLSFALNLLIRTPFFNIDWDYGISLAIMVFIYVVGYLGYRYPEVSGGEL